MAPDRCARFAVQVTPSHESELRNNTKKGGPIKFTILDCDVEGFNKTKPILSNYCMGIRNRCFIKATGRFPRSTWRRAFSAQTCVTRNDRRPRRFRWLD